MSKADYYTNEELEASFKKNPNVYPVADGAEDMPGIKLRDHFAGLAMQGIVSSLINEGHIRLREAAQQEGLTLSEWIARDAYKQADAMLERRIK